MSSFFAPATTALFCQSKRGATLKESGLEHQMCTRYIHQMKKPTLAHANKECQEGGIDLLAAPDRKPPDEQKK